MVLVLLRNTRLLFAVRAPRVGVPGSGTLSALACTSLFILSFKLFLSLFAFTSGTLVVSSMDLESEFISEAKPAILWIKCIQRVVRIRLISARIRDGCVRTRIGGLLTELSSVESIEDNVVSRL